MKMKKVKLTEGEYEFDTIGMVFPVSETLYYYTVRAIDIVKYNRKMMSNDNISKCLKRGKEYEWCYLKDQVETIEVSYE